MTDKEKRATIRKSMTGMHPGNIDGALSELGLDKDNIIHQKLSRLFVGISAGVLASIELGDMSPAAGINIQESTKFTIQELFVSTPAI